MLEKLKNKGYTWLRGSERYLKTDMIYLAKGGFWLALGHGVQLVLGLILVVAFANLLPKETYGTYQFILSLSGIVGAFTLTGMETALVRAIARGSEGGLRYGLRVKLKWSVGIVLAAGAFAIYYYLNNNPLLASALLIVGALQPIITGFDLFKPYLIGKQLFQESSLLGVLQKALPFAFLLPTIFLTDKALVLIAVYFTSHALSSALAYWIVIKRHRPPLAPNPELTNYSIHLSVMASVTKISSYIDNVLIWTLFGAVPVAAYTIAKIPISHMQTIFQFVHDLTFPKLAKKDLPELKEILPRKILQYSTAVIVVIGLYILTVPIIFAIFLPAYAEAVIYSQLLALSLLAVPRALIGQTFAAHQLKREQYIASISTPIVRIISISVLLPTFGIFGAIWAIILTEAYDAALQWRLFKRLR